MLGFPKTLLVFLLDHYMMVAAKPRTNVNITGGSGKIKAHCDVCVLMFCVFFCPLIVTVEQTGFSWVGHSQTLL